MYYAVAKGRKPGIYSTWDECKLQVNQFSGPIFKKFHSQIEAENFIKQRTNSNETNCYKTKVPTLSKRSQLKRELSSKTNSETPPLKRLKTINLSKSFNVIAAENEESPGKFIIDNTDYVNVYTDGACSSNGHKGARAGIGVWFGDDHPLNVSQAVVGRATNNMAEIQAVTIAARQARKAGIKNLKINTDSQFLISCINNWMPKWKANGWKTVTNKPVTNKVELIEMEEALKSLNIIWNHVNGHVGIYGNEMADKLARAGCLKY